MKLLSDKQIGMRESLSGFVANMKGKRINRDARWLIEMLNNHMTEFAQRYYAGDITVVDEFLRLYCKGKEERAKRAEIEKGASHD